MPGQHVDHRLARAGPVVDVRRRVAPVRDLAADRRRESRRGRSRRARTFSACSRPCCRAPMLTTGVPRYEHSLMPADELPTRQAATFSSAMNSSTGTSVMNRIFSDGLGHVLAEVPQAVRHLAGAGVGVRPDPDRRHVRAPTTARSVSSRCRRLSRSVVTGCWMTSRNGCVDVDLVADAVAVDARRW